jgi:VWFA-related protein
VRCRALRKRGPWILWALLAAGIGGAQMAPPPAQSSKQTSPKLVTQTEEVVLDLVVHDKKGRPVSDLKPGEIEIIDGNAPVKISGLRLVNANDERFVTLVFDRFEPSVGHAVRNAALKTLKMAPPGRSAQGDRCPSCAVTPRLSFSVFKIDGRLRLIQPFTTDREALIKAIGAATGEAKDSAAAESDAIKAVNAQDRNVNRTIVTALRDSQRISQDQHARPSLAGLLALARAQQSVPGRKAVVYFTQGMQVDSNAREMVTSIVGAANRSGVSIYAVDANALDQKASDALMASVVMRGSGGRGGGVGATRNGVVGDITPAGMRNMANEQMGRIEMSSDGSPRNPLAKLSTGTGGIYVSGTDAVAKPLRRMIQDLTTYYEASYAPDIEQYDGRFRPVTVKPLRRGLNIQARSGYFAIPPGSTGGIRPFEAPLLKALSQPQLPADLHFYSAVLRLGNMADGNENTVAIEAPLSEFEVREDPNTKLYSVHAAMLSQVRDKSGAIVASLSEDFPRLWAAEAQARAQSENLTLQRHFTADAGEYVLETVVMDANSGKMGATRTKFEIRPLASGPALSDIALIRRIDRFSRDADPFEPLLSANGKVVPNLSGQIARNAKEISMFFVIHSDARASGAPKLEMEVSRDGESIGRVPLQTRAGAVDGPVPYIAAIRATTLAPGNYDAAVRLMQNGQQIERRVSFTVEGQKAPSGAAGAEQTGGNANKEPVEVSSVSDLPRQRPSLAITSLGTSALPSQGERQAILDGARERALDYTDALPNFTCVELTDRSVDGSGLGKWRHRDTITELLRYHDKHEDRVMLEVNGVQSDVTREDLKGTLSHGEFGGLLNAVFNPEAKAEFQAKETDALGNRPVEVFTYRVSREKSTFAITDDSGRQIKTGFHGLVYIDQATFGVRRLTMEAEDLPVEFGVHSAAFTVDYDYIAINDHDYLLPVSATLKVSKGKRSVLVNEMDFRDYRRYGAESHIQF